MTQGQKGAISAAGLAIALSALIAFTGNPFGGSGQSGGGGGGGASTSELTFTSTQTDGGAGFCFNGNCAVSLSSDGGVVTLGGAKLYVPEGLSDSQKVNADTDIGPHAVIVQAATGEYGFRALHNPLWDFGDSTTDYCQSIGGVVACAGGWKWGSVEFDIAGPATPGINRQSLFYPRPFPLGSLQACDSDHLGILQTLTTTNNVYQCNGTDNRGLLRYLRGSAALDFASIAAGADQTLTLTVTGAATTDEVHCSARATLGTGMTLSQSWVSAADTVSITAGNLKLVTATDPASITFDCTILGP